MRSVLFCFLFFSFQKVFQRIQFFVPEPPVLICPVDNLLQLFQVSAAYPLTALLLNDYQPAFCQYPDMFGYSISYQTEYSGHGHPTT